MNQRKMLFYSLAIIPKKSTLFGVSAGVGNAVVYFSTQRKLENWKAKNPDAETKWGINEISLQCAKELVALSKKKVKRRCQECGK